MHPSRDCKRVLREQLESALSRNPDPAVLGHLAECRECSHEFELMQNHSEALKSLRAPEDAEPRPGFYARVMERIEAEGASIWDLFFESTFGKRIAVASLALALLVGVYLVSAERSEQDEQLVFNTPTDVMESMPVDLSAGLGMDVPTVQSVGLGAVAAPGFPDQDSVLVNLVTYREQ